jgi:hypothetical protein
MTRKRKNSMMKKTDSYEKWPSDKTPDQWGEILDGFFEDNEVGMDGVIHWKDATVEEINPYNLMIWYDMDSFRPGIWRTAKRTGMLETYGYGKVVSFQYMVRSAYQGRGSFRYEEPGEDLFSDTEMNLVFRSLSNLGITGSLKF